MVLPPALEQITCRMPQPYRTVNTTHPQFRLSGNSLQFKANVSLLPPIPIRISSFREPRGEGPLFGAGKKMRKREADLAAFLFLTPPCLRRLDANFCFVEKHHSHVILRKRLNFLQLFSFKQRLRLLDGSAQLKPAFLSKHAVTHCSTWLQKT